MVDWFLCVLAPGTNRRAVQVQAIYGGGWPERKTASGYEGWHLQFSDSQKAQRCFSPCSLAPSVLLQYTDGSWLHQGLSLSLKIVLACFIVTDKAGGKKFSKDFEEGSAQLQEFIKFLGNHCKNGPPLMQALSNADIFYEMQYKEVKIVANVSDWCIVLFSGQFFYFNLSMLNKEVVWNLTSFSLCSLSATRFNRKQSFLYCLLKKWINYISI